MEYFIGHEFAEYKLERVVGQSIQKGVRGSTSYCVEAISVGINPGKQEIDKREEGN